MLEAVWLYGSLYNPINPKPYNAKWEGKTLNPKVVWLLYYTHDFALFCPSSGLGTNAIFIAGIQRWPAECVDRSSSLVFTN